MIRKVLLFIAAIVAGTFVMEVLQNIGTDVWIARGLGAVTAAFVGVLGNYLFLRGKPESSPDTRERAEHRNGVQGR
ncbi:MAG: hypothetical protein DI613_10495 [Kocuria rhizophila]|uniref:hypothetical protein n=1 Tax=Kocuria TaxID=57493 RepID=UPI000DB060E4|nr:MAG: hypothetical protein DI613_10495 [Kocuria rhizophila]